MRCVATILILFFFGSSTFAQGSDFEDGTLQNWTDIDGDTTNMSVEFNFEWNSFVMRKDCDGSNSATGRMTIKNNTDYAGNYVCTHPFGINCLGQITFDVISDGSYDLNFRLGFMNSVGDKVVGPLMEVSPFPIGPGNKYEVYDFFEYDQTYTLIEGTSTVEEVLEDVLEFRIIYGEDLSFDGEPIMGTLVIDVIYFSYLLSDETYAKRTVALHPNPTNSILYVESTRPINEYQIYGLDGKLKDGNYISGQDAIDVSNLQSGLYFVKLNNSSGTSIHKFIKN